MDLTSFFIRRPIFATVLSLIILLIGFRAYFALPTRLFPQMDTAVITISVGYPGADAEMMEGFVTTPIENALGGIDGIDYFTSTSSQNSSSITIFFKLGYNIETAISDVNAKIASIRSRLPQDILDPVIEKQDPSSHATMYLNFSGNTLEQAELTDYLSRVVQPQLQTLPGVASAEIWGKNYAMRIWLNAELMAAHDVTATDLRNALIAQNLQAPAGQIETASQLLNIKTLSELKNSDQFNHLVIKQANGYLTRINDIGHADLGVENTRISVFANGQPTVVVPITPAPNANPLDITDEVNQMLPKIQESLPKGIITSVMWDSSKFIAESIKEVKKTILEASICVILIVFLFLGSWRTLLIPAVTIPLSLIGVFGAMYAMGYSLNIITFLALVLAIGMVVDDAIVVSENIHRHMIAGKTPLQAALLGAHEIQFAVIAMTLTLAAVYAPIGFLTGLIGSLFKEFAFTLASAVIISGFVALTLSPMMCSKVLVAHSKEGGFETKIEKISDKTRIIYSKILGKVLHFRKFIVIAIPTIIALCFVLYKFIPSELAPLEDLGAIFVIASGPTSANLSFIEKYTKNFERIFASIPEKTGSLIVNGVPSSNSAFAFIALKPWSQRHRTVDQIIPTLFPQMMQITGIQAFPINESSIPIPGGFMPINLVVQSMGSYQDLNKVMEQLVLAAKQNPNLTNVKSDLNLDQVVLNVNIDRDKAGDLGVSIKDIGDAINLTLGQPTVSRFSIMGRSYDIIPELDTTFNENPQIINNLNVTTAAGNSVPLSNFVKVKESLEPQSLNHFQQMRSATLSASMMPGYTMGQALDYLQKVSKKIITPGMQISYSGLSRQYFETGNQMLFTFILSIVFIFLVLAAQFESFRDPFIVLFSIPLSTFGALLALILTRNTMNIYSEIGIITLIGLISKHGILMVEFANQLRKSGEGISQAIIKAASVRLRPILMTTSAIILGAVPLAFASGAGAASRQQIGCTIIGGMLIGTLFTLLIVPIMYTYLAGRKHHQNQ